MKLNGTEAVKHAVALPSFPTDNSILARLWSSSANDELLPGVMELRIRVGYILKYAYVGSDLLGP